MESKLARAVVLWIGIALLIAFALQTLSAARYGPTDRARHNGRGRAHTRPTGQSRPPAEARSENPPPAPAPKDPAPNPTPGAAPDPEPTDNETPAVSVPETPENAANGGGKD